MPKTRPPFDGDFRQEAVNLLLGSGRPLKRVAAERPLPIQLGRSAALQRENEYLRRQREILKKSHEHTLRGPAERYALIDSMRAQFSISELCAALGGSRSGYHAARSRPPAKRHTDNQQLLDQMTSIHSHRHTRSYGSPRMTRELHALGLEGSPSRVARLMRQAGLRARPRRPFRPKTTEEAEGTREAGGRASRGLTTPPILHRNLLTDAGPPHAPGSQLVSDITYIPTREGWLYLAVVIDLFSRAILGWKLSDSLHTNLVTGALRRALDTGLVCDNAIFHSDRGCQYSAAATRTLLASHGLRQSMSAAGYCYDNAFAESAFASLKSDILDDGRPFDSKQSATTALFDYLESFYNRRRRHNSLDYQSPQTFLNRYFQSLNPSLN